MRFTAILLVTAFSCIVSSAFTSDPAVPNEDEARKSGEGWLSLVGAQNYQESWKEASAQFRSAVTPEQWAAALKAHAIRWAPCIADVLAGELHKDLTRRAGW